MWIDFLVRKLACDQDTIKMITPSDYLSEYTTNQMSLPSTSSWGHKGYGEHWLEGSNDWVYPHIHEAGRRMVELAQKFESRLTKENSKESLIERSLNQAARELLLAESSDWPFIMKTGTMVPYAEKRIKQHIGRFTRLYDDLMKGTVDEDWLKEVEQRDNIFKNINCAQHYGGST